MGVQSATMSLPPIGPDPHLFTADECDDLPFKLELCDGILFCDRKARLDMLMALMANVGLHAVAKLAPRVMWDIALNG